MHSITTNSCVHTTTIRYWENMQYCKSSNVYGRVGGLIPYALNFRGVYISRILSFKQFSRLNIRGRPCFVIAQEPDLNFCGSKLSRMASYPRIP